MEARQWYKSAPDFIILPHERIMSTYNCCYLTNSVPRVSTNPDSKIRESMATSGLIVKPKGAFWGLQEFHGWALPNFSYKAVSRRISWSAFIWCGLFWQTLLSPPVTDIISAAIQHVSKWRHLADMVTVRQYCSQIGGQDTGEKAVTWDYLFIVPLEYYAT